MKNLEEKSVKMRILARIRPMEVGRKDGVVVVATGERDIEVRKDKEVVGVRLDFVFGPQTCQADIFNYFQDIPVALARGINSSLMVYGQSGSGKTYTVFGREEYSDGLIPRILGRALQVCPVGSILGLSFLQIYKEKLEDLFSVSKTVKIKIREKPGSGTYLTGLRNLRVTSVAQTRSLLALGESRRVTRGTKANIHSSRSHAIVIINYRSKTTGSTYTSGRITVCDLAGCERMTEGLFSNQLHFRELKSINLSLVTLGRVINGLSGSKGPPPASLFRQSKLTRIIQDSFIGNGRTSIIATINPSEGCRGETLRTLRLVQRAGRISTKVTRNVRVENSESVILQLQDQVMGLEEELGRKRDREGSTAGLIQRIKRLTFENRVLKGNIHCDCKNGIKPTQTKENTPHFVLDIQHESLRKLTMKRMEIIAGFDRKSKILKKLNIKKYRDRRRVIKSPDSTYKRLTDTLAPLDSSIARYKHRKTNSIDTQRTNQNSQTSETLRSYKPPNYKSNKFSGSRNVSKTPIHSRPKYRYKRASLVVYRGLTNTESNQSISKFPGLRSGSIKPLYTRKKQKSLILPNISHTQFETQRKRLKMSNLRINKMRRELEMLRNPN